MSPILPDRCYALNIFLWKCAFFGLVLDAIGLFYRHIHIDMGQALYLPVLLLVCLLVSFIYRYVRKDPPIFLFSQMAAQLIALTAVLGIFSYLMAGFTLPLIDDILIKIDRLFAFDWLRWLNWLNDSPRLAQALSMIYRSLEPQILIVFIVLFLSGKLPHLQRFLIAFFYSAVLVILLSALLPAVGGFIHYNPDMTKFANLHPGAVRDELLLVALRSHEVSSFTFPLQGIVIFPSFHSALAVLMIYAARPVRWLSPILIVLNILVLVSTPGDGGHYLCDVLAGTIIALHAIRTAKRMLPPQDDKIEVIGE